MNTKILIPVVAMVAAVAAFYMLVLTPKREEITRLDAEIATQNATAEQFEQQAAAYAKAKAQLPRQLHDDRTTRQGRARR